MPLDSRTLAEQIAALLRDDILCGRLEGGQRLSQERLADQFAVSRIPVRDALTELHAEGLITRQTRSGVRVAELSVVDLEELYDMRLALEPVLACLATPRLRSSDVDQMAAQLSIMELSVEPSQGWLDANAAFHRALNLRAGRPRMIALVDKLREQTERYIRQFQVLPGAGQELGVGHGEIFRAVTGGNPEAVASAVRDHMKLVRDRLLVHLRTQGRHE